MASIIEELAAKTRAGGGGALPSAAATAGIDAYASASPRQGERKSSIILELAAKSGMNINADINTLKNAATLPATGADTAAETEQKQNTGGFFGGVGYLANKVGVGFVSSLEGGIDYIAGGLAKLFGADDWAEEVMGTDWFDYSHPENWYNPSRGWQVAGDVFGGIGTSLPAIGTVAAAAALVGASGGALTPLATGLISAGVAGLNAAGRSTSEAYKRTGTLGGKEWAYGTLSGTTEGAVEGLSTALGLGVARLGAKLAGSAGGNAAKELIKTATFGGVLKEMGKSFIGEASEEAISEILDPLWQRMTIDEYAPSATAKEVGYAALVGGLSGILMDGTASGIQRTGSILRGNRINGKGNTASVLDTARSISDFEGKNKTGIQDFAYISEAYGKLTDSIKSTDGKVTTMAQKKLLGDLAAANNSYNIKRFVATDAYNIVSNAEAIAENLEKFGYRTVDGKEMRYSAAELTAGYDAKKPKSIYKALETNEALRSLAVTAATGRLLIDTARTEQATLAGEALMSKADLARFLETASAEEIHGVEEAFGIEDLRTADADTLRNRIIAFTESGGIEAAMQKRQNATELAAIPASEVGVIPTTDIYMADGEAHRYSDGDLNIAISRKGDAYLIYDYNTKKLSRELSEYEMNEYLSEYRRGKEAYIVEQRAYTERQAEKAKRAELSREVRGKADVTLRENIKGYAASPATLQAQLRKVYHDAVVSGISEADALSYARVSERTGLDMIFSRELCATADGSYADGYYDPIKNRIVINPETKRAHGALLMHELTHAIYYKDGKLTIAEGIEKMPAEKKQAIMKKYTKAGITDSVTLADEMNAHYAEETLRSFGTLEKLCADKPTLKEKILSFFRGAEADYRGDAKLTKAAKQLYAQYKKLFDSFAAKGRGSNAMDLMPVRRNADTEGNDGRRYSVQDGKVIVDTDQHIFDGVSREDYGKVVRQYMRQHFRGKEISGAEFTKRSEHEYTHSGYSQSIYGKRDGVYEAKMKAATELDKMISTGAFIGHEDAKHQHEYNKEGYDRYGVKFNLGGEDFSGEMLVAIGEGNRHIFYDIVNIKRGDRTFTEELSAPMTATSDNSIHENSEKVNTLNKKSDGKRYALPEGESAFDAETADAKGLPRSMGQVKRTRANNRFERVYSKKAAINIAGKISGIEFLSKKAQAQVVSDIWETLNNCTSMDEKLDAAHTAADSIVTKLLSEAKEANPAALEAQQKLVQLRTGLHGISFSEADASEIIAADGVEGWKSIRSRWGYQNRNDGRGGNRIPMDVFVTDISREMQGMERLENMHPADAFIEMNRIYEQAQQDAKNKWTQQYLDADADEIQYMTDSIRDTIMKAFAEEGEKSAFAKTMEERLEKAKNTIAELRADNTTIKKRIRIEGLLAGDGQRLKDIKIGTFGNATQFQSENLKGILGMAAKINYRGGFNATGARKVVQGLRNWYNDSDVQKYILGYKGTTETGLYSADVAGMLEELSNPRHGDAFTNDELSNLHKVYQYFIHITENYGKIYRHGRMVEALPIAEEKIAIIENNRQIKRNPFTWALTNIYGQAVFKPIEVVRAIDGYENGFNTEMVLDIREASEQAAIKEMGLKREYDDFFAKNKKYAETLQNERMTYADITMPKSRLIALYMTYKREQAQAGLLYSGYKFRDTDGSYISSLPLLTQDTRMTKAEIKSMAESIAKEIESKFSATDKQYIAILERAFEAAGKLKMERDIQRMGYSNLTGGYYFPIIRANSAKSIDSAEAELDRVSNASFNKDTVKGAKQRLFIDDADAIFRRHIHAVSQYNALSPVIEAYNTLYNLDISGNPNAPKSIATEMENVWESGNRYMKKLFSDVQGIRGEMDVGNKAVNFLRGGYAKYQLGLNPKTWFKQLTSLAASTSILDWDSLSAGVLTGVSKDVDTYCPLAALRNYEDTAAMAQSVLDTAGKKAKNKLGRFSDALMTPIGKIDRFVVERLFGGCQVQVAKESGGKLAIGTEANKVAAGKMLAQVIRDTQQNALATEKSAAMRSNNEIVRAFTMFTADGVAVMSKMLGTYGEYWTLREKLKTATDANVRTELTARLKTVGKAARKSTIALISTAIFGAGVDFFFRWLYNKLEDKPEDEVKNFAGNTMMGMIGGLPIIKDIVSKAFEGYDIKNYTYSAMNDMISSLTDLVGTTKDWLSDKDNEQARNKALKNFAYSMGQVFGLPVRNTYNLVYGLTKRIVPSTAYEWDTHFYTKTYGSDFSAALEKDDTDTASFILSLMTKNEVGGELDEKVRSEFVALAKSGNKVLPKSVPDSITADGTVYKFTRSEKEAIRAEYASVNATVKKLVSNVRYRIMDENTRAYALKYVYNAHLEKAYSEVLYGGARDAEMIAADIIGIDMMAIAKAIKKSVQGDTDNDGKAISGSKRQNIIARIRVLPMTSEEKLFLIAMLGYKIQAGDIGGMDESRAKKKLLSYIFAQRLTADEKAALCIKCGFEVKNGRVSTKNL